MRTHPETWAVLKDAARQHRHEPTPAERALWARLRGSQTGERFRRQHAIGPYMVDFYAAAAKLVVELDGSSHDGREDQDTARTAFLESAGLKVISFRNEDVLTDIEAVVTRILTEL